MSTTYKTGQKDTRPWGDWEILDASEEYIVKRLRMTPHNQFSLQLHNHRTEHWIIAEGTATITLDDKVFEAPQGTHIFVDKGQKHRMANNTEDTLICIEVQAGDTSEDDIVRFEDAYGRV